MAPVTPPNNLQAGTYSARLDRLATACLLAPQYAAGPLAARPGIKPAPAGATSGLVVTQRSTPDMHVTVGPGTVYIPATSVIGGAYECHNDAPYDVPVTAAHASLPRRDLIIARVYDAVDDTGSLNQFAIEAVTGTPASSPTLPGAPSQSYVLAQVLVPAASASVVTANITDVRTRTVALGGILPCRTAADVPASPYPGQAIYREDTGITQVYNGLTSAWGAISDTGSWTSLTLASARWANRGSGYPNLRARKIDSLTAVWVVGDVVWTSGSSTGLVSSTVLATLPSGYRPTNEQKIKTTFGSVGDASVPAPYEPNAAVGSDGVIRIYNVTVPSTTGKTCTLELFGMISLDA